MSVITSRLSMEQELKLCSLLGQDKLTLLFKASVHGFTADAFHRKCDRQGSTVTVAYNDSGYIFGAYTSKDYTQTGQNIMDDKAFMFSFNEREVDKAPLRWTSTNAQCSFIDGNTGPNYVSLLFLHNNTATVYSNPGTYNFIPVEMHGNDLQLSECEVYRVEELRPLMEKQWRNIEWSIEKRKSVIDAILRWTPSVSSVQKARVLLVGPVGAGKSSFFNSIDSVFKGHVSSRANTGITGTSLTTQFRVYSIKAGDKFLPITLCDSMGLEEGANAGMDIEDFTNILKGHIQDRYPFNPSVPLQSDSPYYCEVPSMQEKIHAVVYVMDACKVNVLSDKLIEKLSAFRRKANHMGVQQMVLLTKVDEVCHLAGEDMKYVYRSDYLRKTIQEVSVCLGISPASVVPVKNYSKELEVEPHTDIMLLNAVQQILRTAEAYFDNVVCKEEEE
ncbi:interferon-induced protein 44-like [Clarias gariepinus]|uniref:interferon-induced protein 44-like n=1 Tax=Clarias gariepinus TaxID=13013 RepID=UPI00234CC8C1|nr:interferon-induced protein 44-like [Clarias gariepinus]